MPIDRVPGLYDPESVRGWQLIKSVGAFIVCTVFLVWLLFHWPKPPDHLINTGIQVEGRVYEVQSLQNGKERISYGFMADGSTISIKDRSVNDLDGVQRLGPITVWFNPANPRDCITPNELRGRTALPRLLVIPLFLVVLGLLALYIWSLMRRSGSLL
jgi:hypothetical protein